ncbi:hypothetical protein EUGRSUZ_G00743 [Eucalyptus grandis]|uniref:Uncharacterized protein n=2 Tax=Eucalyptus grandis TaxID=71139 RepID=A0ACC3K1V2_EUCGR|nr:hypothetical protein EUGRSUZ_G00743 [Eucalyptus grandis]
MCNDDPDVGTRMCGLGAGDQSVPTLDDGGCGFGNESRYGKMIQITSIKIGCDESHAYQPPCPNNVVDGLDAVWIALGLDKNVGQENVTL